MESRANEQQISSQMREGFEAYAERMKQIRSLATPTLNEIRIPDDYSHVLKINFQRIGEMAAENRKIIADYIQPVLKSEEDTLFASLIWGRNMNSEHSSIRAE